MIVSLDITPTYLTRSVKVKPWPGRSIEVLFAATNDHDRLVIQQKRKSIKDPTVFLDHLSKMDYASLTAVEYILSFADCRCLSTQFLLSP